MKRDEQSIISETELNALLARAFLNLDKNHNKTEKVMETVAQYTLVKNHQTFTTFKKALLLGIVFAGFVFCAFAFFNHNTDSHNNYVNNNMVSQIKKETLVETAPKKEIKKVFALKTKAERTVLSAEADDLVTQVEGRNYQWQEFQVNQTQPSEPAQNFAMLSNTSQEKTDEYVFPVLTEKEMKYNEKQKKRMLRLITKLNNAYYPKIKTTDGMPSFYMQAAEITNLEYRTFLFDLLIQGKKEDFLKAKPSQDLWINAADQTTFNYLAKDYFTEKKYNDYPVVNISPQGAEMYCNWLESELELINAKDNKAPKVKISLPNETEWMIAASAGRKNAMYPWPHDSIQNRVNCFMANCCFQKLKEKIRLPICNNHEKVDESCYTTAGMMLRDPGTASVLVWCYNPNAFGLYAMSGNVSELVYADENKNIKTKGGNWASDFEHLVLNSEDEFELNPKASPKIGFRIIIKIKM